MAQVPEFKYAPMFQLGKDTTEYRLLSKEGVSTAEFEGKTILKVSKEALTMVAQQGFHDVEFMLRREHNLQVAKILEDPEASENDKYVALQFLRNAETAAKGILPFCQDTGTAIIHGEKGQRVWTDFEDEEALSLGVYNTFTEDNLRYSQNAPLNMYDEVNTRCNLPAQIDIEATEGDEYRFVMVAKGGGSANKTYFYPMTKATIQNEGTLLPFLVEKMKSLGTAACPPYHIAFVIGGTSAEKNLLTVKLASIKYYDSLPTTGDETGRAFRDIDLEEKLLKEAYKIGLGAQFGGKYLAHDIRVVRLPRHGASCPIGMGVSCSADRNIKAKINKDGIWIEKMDANPSELIPEEYRKPGEGAKGIEIDLDKGIDAVRAELTKYPVSTRVSLKGTIIVARDIAHAKLKARLDAGEEMPEYFNRAFDFLKERVGEENIISAVVHMDEKTPHLHLCFVPLTKDKRLSAKEILGNKKSMIRWQDDFYAYMAERWPELERGTPAVETKRRHLTPQWYKKVTAMDAKLERLETALNDINMFNAGKKREEAVALLAQLLPDVESFQIETQRMQKIVALSISQQRRCTEENEALKSELAFERRKSFEQRAKLDALEKRYKRAEMLLNSVPKEIRVLFEREGKEV